MAEEAKEPNSVEEDCNVKDEEADVLELVQDKKDNRNEEEPKNRPAAESTWSAPILSLARKASETISSGVNTYGAALKNAAPSSASSTSTTELSSVDETPYIKTGKFSCPFCLACIELTCHVLSSFVQQYVSLAK